MSRLPALALALPLAALALAAPVPKERDDKPGPVTDEQRTASRNNLKRILLGVHNHEAALGFFPNNLAGAKGEPLLSWRVAVLPYLEVDGEDTAALYKKFKLDEAWDGEANRKLVERMPAVFAPVRVRTKERGHTFYRGFTGTGAVFEAGLKLTMAGVTDGTSNTAAVVEAGEAVAWTRPDDLPFDPAKGLPKLGGLFDGEFHLGLCDGSVRRVRAAFDADVMKAVITRGGGAGPAGEVTGRRPTMGSGRPRGLPPCG